MTESITSVRNPLVREVVGLHSARGRRDADAVLVEGPTVLAEALATGRRPRLILTTDPEAWDDGADRVVAVSPAVLERVATTVTPQDPVAVLDRPLGHPTSPLRLVAWQITDPGNLGTIVRGAAAFGADLVVGGVGAADPWSPKALRAGAGAHFRICVAEADDISAAIGDRPAAALVVDGGVDPGLLADRRPLCLVVGSEAHGLPTEVIDRCQARVTIPMPGGTESLNAAMAASIALYAMTRGH
ncbi:MAG: RNA methyltransferase [Acidimicrobiia bacterium]